MDKGTFLRKGRFWRWQIIAAGDLLLSLIAEGVGYECLDNASIDGLTKRLESALRLFDENYRVYQYLFKRNNQTIRCKRRSRRPRVKLWARAKNENCSNSNPSGAKRKGYAKSWQT
jgi:hypothetical protein